MSEFEVGDHVRVIKRDNGDPDLGTIGCITRVEPRFVYGDFGTGRPDHCMRVSEVEPVNEAGVTRDRSTYRLLKATAELKAGAVVQEKCDYGDQDYLVLDESFVKYPNEGGSRRYTLPRGAVENEPQWFVEVFKIHPEYMTREELDQWEAFKAQGTKKPKASAPVAKKTTRRPWTPAQRKAASLRMKAIHAAKKKIAK